MRILYAAIDQRVPGIPGIEFVGRLPHEQMPAALAAADVGVAPFDVSAHAPLTLAFYGSPLKLFEYMSAGLPVVAPRINRLDRLARDEQEGLLYDPSSSDGLTEALTRLMNPTLRTRLGAAARQRAETAFSWKTHCCALEPAMTNAVRSREHHA